jgi:hypothetical protein
LSDGRLVVLASRLRDDNIKRYVYLAASLQPAAVFADGFDDDVFGINSKLHCAAQSVDSILE